MRLRSTKGIGLAVLTMGVVLSGAFAPAHAEGDQRRCVSQREYRDVQVAWDRGPGWRQARVTAHFDIHGTRIRFEADGTGQHETVWKYRKCAQWGPGGRFVAIWYINYLNETDTYNRAWGKRPNRPYALAPFLNPV